MKKNIFRFATLMMAAAIVFAACDGKDEPKKPVNPNGPTEKTGTVVPITLDGAFTDWDAITEETAKDNLYAAYFKADPDEPIQVLKLASAQDRINFYIEFAADLLPQNETCTTWGNSYSGTPEKGYSPDGAQEGDDTFREVMHLFIDPDGDDRTGFLTFDNGVEEPVIPGLGCEMCAQFFMFFKPSTKLVSIAWEQTIIGPTHVGTVGDNDQVDAAGYTGPFDYNGTFCQSWKDSGEGAAFPLWGWQNPDNSGKGDNDAPRQENWKPAPAEGNVAKVEFAILFSDFTNKPAEAEECGIGIVFKWGESDQNVGPIAVSYVKE